jgi:serine/threonine protein kinase/WD40 repeat protein/tetratricopeptide (TPR) repeat protein
MSDPKTILDSLFETAIEIESVKDRAAFLDKSCGKDSELREQLERMLRLNEQASSFRTTSPAEPAATIVNDGSEGNLSAVLEAGLASAFTQDYAIVLGDGSHSVLKMLGQTLDGVPRVALRQSVAEGPEPITRPKSAEMPKIGSDSRYQLHGEIARGGMGAVLKGRDTDLGRDLAIKVLLDQHKDKPEVVQRFVEEAQIGGQLQHPGIAPIYELGQFADNRPFFAMKLVKGETLAKLLADRKDSAEDRGRFISIFEQICQTMAYAHSRGVIHRDLKPANIMVGAFGEVQVMDWGLAKVLPTGGVADEKTAHDRQQGQSIIQTLRTKVGTDVPGGFGSFGSHTQMGSVMGTPAYMPPEQALGEIDHLDERADVFGLGAILSEILTGKPPYVGDDGTKVFRMASRGKLEDCLQRLDDCGADADLIALAKHCLELEPTDRPRDAGVLAERVSSYLQSVETRLRETEMQRVAESARVIEARKRTRLTMALAASVLLLVSLGSGGWLFMERQEAQRQTAHAADMKRLAEQREVQRRAAESAEEKARAAEVVALQEKETARVALARSQTSLAEAAYREFDSPAMLAALGSVPEELRDGDWRYLRERAENSQFALTFPEDNYFVGVAPHPTMPGVFAGALKSNKFVFVDALSGQHLFEFPGTDRQRRAVWCRAMDFSSDGSRMIAGALLDGGVAIYDTSTGKAVAQWDATDIDWVRFSPDGTKSLDRNMKGELTMREATDGKLLWTLNSAGNAVFSPKGDEIYVIGYAVRVFDSATGELIRTLPDLRADAVSLALSPDGSVLYLGCLDGVVRGQRLSDGAIIFEQRLTENGRWVQVAVSGDGRRLVGVVALPGLRRKAQVWDAATGITLQTLIGGTGQIEGVAIHPLTDEVIISGPDTRTWTLATRTVESNTIGNAEASVFWGAEDVFIGKNKPAMFGADGVWSDLPSPISEDGEGFAADAAGEIAAVSKVSNDLIPFTIFRKKTDGCVLMHTVKTIATLIRIRLSADGSRLVVFDPGKTAEVFDTATGEKVCHCDGNVVRDIWDLGWSGADRIIGIGTRNLRGTATAEERVFLWDASNGKILNDVRNTASADVIDVAPDGRTFAEGGENKRVRIRDAQTLEVLHEFRAHDAAITAMAFHPTQPVLATGSSDLKVRLWNLTDHSLIEEIRPSADEPVKLAFSPGGSRLASTDRGATVSFLNLIEPPLGKFTRRNSTRTIVAANDLYALPNVTHNKIDSNRFQEVLLGEAQPTDNDERLRLALYAFNNQKFRLANRLWNEVLESETSLEDELRLQLRYGAARAAILAVAAKGEDEPMLDDAAKAKLQKESHDWLLAELAANHASEPKVTEMAADLANLILTDTTPWRVLKPTKMKSQKGATLTLQQDGSILASGDDAIGDAYTIRAATEVDRVAVVRLEVLPDPSLPNNGPGRHPSGNFQLSALRLFLPAIDDTPDRTRLSLASAFASFDYKADDADIAGLLDEDLQKVWHVWGHIGETHQAIFLISDTVAADSDQTIVVELHHREDIDAVNLGRFRLSVSDDPEVFNRERLRLAALRNSDPWGKLAAAYMISGDQPALDTLRTAHPVAYAAIGELYAAENNWEQAIAVYNQLITSETTDAEQLAKRAAAYMSSEQWELAKADWLRALESQPGLAQTAFDGFRSAERWSDATVFGSIMMKQEPTNSYLWIQIAPIVVLSQDQAAYRSFCQETMENHRNTPEVIATERAIKSCLLRPGAIDATELPGDLLAKPLNDGTYPEGFHPWGWTTLAFLAYRNGDAESALKHITQSEQLQPSDYTQALNLAVRALAQHQLRHPDEARKALDESSRVIKELQSSPKHHDVLVAEILYREAETMINGDTDSDLK